MHLVIAETRIDDIVPVTTGHHVIAILAAQDVRATLTNKNIRPRTTKDHIVTASAN
jgi:hypothetical protein